MLTTRQACSSSFKKTTHRTTPPSGVLLLHVPIKIAVSGYGKSTNMLHKQLAWVALIYMGTVVVGGMWDEVGRMALPLILESVPAFVPVKSA